MKPRNHKISLHIITDAVLIFLLIIALAGYIAAEWPNDYGRVSRGWVETAYWLD